MEQTPSAIRNSELAEWRSQLAKELRDLANLLYTTTHDQFPTPNVHVSLYSWPKPTDDDIYNEPSLNQADVRNAMAATPGRWSKLNLTNSISYTKELGDAVRIHFHVGRDQVCTRVQTGTKHVEATEAHDEPVYEWVCTEPEIEV